MALLNELLPLLREKCSGMMEQMAKDQLKRAYRNFCIESGYVERTETLSVAIDGTVTLTPDAGHYIHAINGIDDEKGKELRSGIDYKVASGNKVTVTDRYTQVVITYSIVPKLPMVDNIIVDDNLLARWPDEIAAGAAALLRLMPKQSWTDISLSDFYQRDFTKGHREAYRARVSANDERQFQPQSKRVFF